MSTVVLCCKHQGTPIVSYLVVVIFSQLSSVLFGAQLFYIHIYRVAVLVLRLYIQRKIDIPLYIGQIHAFVLFHFPLYI